MPVVAWEGGIGMIIDSHVHLIGEGWMNRSLVIGIGRLAAAAMGKTTGKYPDPEGLVASVMPTMTDTMGEKLVALMDRAGVDKSVIFAADLGLCSGEPEVRIQEQNRVIAEVARRFPGRLVPFFAIDPRRTKAMDMFRLAVEEWGMRGLKLHTVTGYYPHDRVAYPFYEKCMEYGIPVVFHTGSTCAPMKSRFAQPIHLDDVAADFPDLPIVMAHVAQEMWEEALTVARMKTNVYFDISGWQAAAVNRPRVFYRMLRELLDEVGPWRVFFASDGPFSELACPLDRWVKALTKPDLSSCPEVVLAPDEIEIVMGKAFARLLKL